jgi:hypothetical protein
MNGILIDSRDVVSCNYYKSGIVSAGKGLAGIICKN